MEDSKIRAGCVYNCDAEIDTSKIKIKNISDLSDYVTKYDYGDIVKLSDYRDTETYFIGKKGKLIGNPDYSGSGYLSVPYKITQYLDDALFKYEFAYGITHIDLRYDDKFIKENINTNDCKILKSWNLKLTYYYSDILIVKLPNGMKRQFKVNNTDALKIKKWVEGSQQEQFLFDLYFKTNYDSDIKPKLPFAVDMFNTGQIYTSSKGERIYEFNYSIKGPINVKQKVIDIIKDFYKDYDYKLTDM